MSASSPCVPSCKNSLESPAYAYVLVNPPLPGRLLASGNFTSTSTGAFSAIISSGKTLGASKLTFLTLGRDSNGLAITVQDKSTQESTILQSKIPNIPTATQNQHLTLILHLTSNSTIIDMTITISLNVEGSGVVQTQSGILISHGTSKDVPFNFNAPPKVGVYSLTFFSPEYGAPLITGTLQVSVLQSSLRSSDWLPLSSYSYSSCSGRNQRECPNLPRRTNQPGENLQNQTLEPQPRNP